MTFYEGSTPSVTAKKPAMPVLKFLIVFMATMVRPLPGGVSTLPFFYAIPGASTLARLIAHNQRQ